MSVKYDEAAYQTPNQQYETIKLEDAISKKEEDKQKFRQKYQDHLFCPECHIPQLTLVNLDGHYYFRGYPNQMHAPTCSKAFESISTETLQAFAALNDANQDFLLQRLQRFVHSLMRRANNAAHPLLLQLQNNQITLNDIEPANICNRQLIRRIPTKSITAPIHAEDLDCYKLFYGNVDIQYLKKENQDYSFFVLEFLRRRDSSLICSLSFSQRVAAHLETDYGLNLNQRLTNQYVAFFSVMKQNNRYLNARLPHSKLFYIAAE